MQNIERIFIQQIHRIRKHKAMLGLILNKTLLEWMRNKTVELCRLLAPKNKKPPSMLDL